MQRFVERWSTYLGGRSQQTFIASWKRDEGPSPKSRAHGHKCKAPKEQDLTRLRRHLDFEKSCVRPMRTILGQISETAGLYHVILYLFPRQRSFIRKMSPILVSTAPNAPAARHFLLRPMRLLIWSWFGAAVDLRLPTSSGTVQSKHAPRNVSRQRNARPMWPCPKINGYGRKQYG